ncbi:bifunctional folylpolyglutamate synthase/dihydrofolate synthase [Solitalea canadensis]|uniref:Dihydrofolate synthase/folylpolyglutamate synthase n=1 Tax=Solitalea canadensis (strain ATCC 29591 / DSM 3403 / JCM 21819 / LMG 8368 / NBRC 15130 / NCIMB 12057 / USAM 9D) TaxID=929556 RepID=H8KY56_SOLCM|nr:folylpolyglutamate synthase/dihydrofolate synthase family protein [Solitalea canadensis]AFD05794.1 folylpolyglutamate synthase/dihydrofolate synthase [Solitalea canadensis DSM 3403]
MLTYQQTLDYLFSRLPMFHRIGEKAFKADLHNIKALSEILDNPHTKFKSIHIAGTNGKGSTSHMLAAILQEAGYKTGLYTSPHLRDFRERIRINGQMIPEQNVIDFVANYKVDFEKIEPSFFEMGVALAFDYFEQEKVDIAVIETGLGGRLDSTNIITPLLSVITNISFDHTSILGNTIEAIAGEKAGIIKDNVPVVIGQKQELASEIFIEKALQTNSPITFASENWKITNTDKYQHKLILHVSNNSGISYPNLALDLTGNYQLKNIKTVLESVESLRAIGFNISDNHIYCALSQVKHLTGLLGRWYTLSENPLIICDTGHNVDGITQVVEQINETPHDQLYIVFGMVKDKDISHVLALMPKEASYYFCKADIPRGMDANELQKLALNFGLNGDVYSSVIDALNAAKQKAAKNDLVFVGGSTFVVAEVI